MKITLQNGGCSSRFTCLNVNKECCKSIPKKDEDFIECDNYEVS